MKRTLFAFLILADLALGQGWEHLGPDSLSWREAHHLTGHWLNESTFYLAASTSAGIAIYSNVGLWNYTLRDAPPRDYAVLDFSPWEPDSCFVGYYVLAEYPQLHVVKTPFPPLSPPSSEGLTGPCWGGPISVAFPPNNGSVVFAGVCGVKKSTDRGCTWDTLSDEGLSGNSRLVGTDESDPNILFRAMELFSRPGGILFRSTTGGATWDTLFRGLPRSGYLRFASTAVARGDTILLGLSTYPADTSTTGAVMRSTDGGVTWAQTFAQGRVAGLALTSGRSFPGESVCAATSLGLFTSTDWGLSWSAFNTTLPTAYLTDLILHPFGDTAYVSTTSHGVLKVWRFTTAVEQGHPRHPKAAALLPNYPNPFNPATTIGFDLPERSHSVLAVFDPLGRELIRLVDAVLETGRHEIRFDGSHLPSGVYLYRLIAGAHSAVRKMTVLK